jgi:iron(III) transport system substrate-binding protein
MSAVGHPCRGRFARSNPEEDAMSRTARTVALAIAIAGSAMLAAAHAQEAPKELLDAARREGKVTVYGSTESEVMQAVQQAFEAKYGIKVEYWRASSTKVMDRALTEARAGTPLFDVVLTNATPMKILKREGLFARSDLPAAARYPDNARDRDGVLSPPYRVVVVGVLYNTRLVKAADVPRTLKDLLQPKWKGKIVMPDPTRHSTTMTWLVGLQKLLGPDWKPFVDGLAAQKPIMVESFIPAVKKVIGGEALLGISYLKYVYIMGTREGAPVDYARLNPVLGDVHHVAVGAKASSPNAARLFANYFISPEGLKILAAQGEFVLAKGLYPPIKDAEKLEITLMEDLTDDELKTWRGAFKKIFF